MGPWNYRAPADVPAAPSRSAGFGRTRKTADKASHWAAAADGCPPCRNLVVGSCRDTLPATSRRLCHRCPSSRSVLSIRRLPSLARPVAAERGHARASRRLQPSSRAGLFARQASDREFAAASIGLAPSWATRARLLWLPYGCRTADRLLGSGDNH